MEIDKQHAILDVLKHNIGFDKPEEWIAYAKEHDFVRCDARKIAHCPDCGNSDQAMLGQYIYYSNLMNLVTCDRCGLIYSDVRLSDEVLKRHFD